MDLPDHLFLFSESQSRFIISVKEENGQAIEEHFAHNNVPIVSIGQVGGPNLSINDRISVTVDELEQMYYNTIPGLMEQ